MKPYIFSIVGILCLLYGLATYDEYIPTKVFFISIEITPTFALRTSVLAVYCPTQQCAPSVISSATTGPWPTPA